MENAARFPDGVSCPQQAEVLEAEGLKAREFLAAGILPPHPGYRRPGSSRREKVVGSVWRASPERTAAPGLYVRSA